jgi:hypothetical protein
MPDQRDPSKVMVTVYVDRDLRDAVNARAKEKGETVAAVLTRALKRYAR